METEIKLKLYRGDLSALLVALNQTASITAPAQVKMLDSRYYDTPDRQLGAKRIALRVRRTDAGFIQTVKTEAPGASVLFARGEWETTVPSFVPQFEDMDTLGEIFATEIERRKLIALYPPGNMAATRIEVAIDQGRIRAGAKEEAVSEVELELMDGHPADIFDMGARLAEQVPLQLSIDSKSARGYRLAAGEPPGTTKADKLEFDADISLEAGMRASLRACVQHWFANQAAVIDGRDMEGVHQMRVGLRRLRSAIVFFRRYIPDPPLTEFKDQAKWVASSLGPARDWDVFVTETLAPVMSLWPEHRGLRALASAAEHARQAGYTEARMTIASPAYTVFALRLAGWIERSGWRAGLDAEQMAAMGRPMTELAAALLDKLHDKALKIGKNFETLEVHEKHEVRIALKKLRYAGEFFRSLYPKKDVKRFRDALTDTLELLGKLNDLSVARELCGRLMETGEDDGEMPSGTAGLLDWHERQGHVSDDALAKAWAGFRDAEPFWRG